MQRSAVGLEQQHYGPRRRRPQGQCQPQQWQSPTTTAISIDVPRSIQPGHFAVEPDQVEVGISEAGVVGGRLSPMATLASHASTLSLPGSDTGLAAAGSRPAVLAGHARSATWRHAVQSPSPLPASITLAAHQKAADQGLAARRFGSAGNRGRCCAAGLGTLFEVCWRTRRCSNGWAAALALIAGFVLIGSLVELPLACPDLSSSSASASNKMNSLSGWSTPSTYRARRPDRVADRAHPVGHGGHRSDLVAVGLVRGWVSTCCCCLILPDLHRPRFNKFQPLEDESLKARVTALMQRCGFAASAVRDGRSASAVPSTPARRQARGVLRHAAGQVQPR